MYGHKLVWLAIALVSAGATGCKRKTPSGEAARPVPGLGPVVVEDLTPPPARPEGVTVDTAGIEQRVRKALQGSGFLAPGPHDAGGALVARVRLEFGLENVAVDDKAAARAAVRLRIDTRPSEVAAPHWNEDVQAGSETQYQVATAPNKQELFNKLVNRTVDDLMAAYLARQKLWVGPPTALRETMRADAGELQIEAIRIVGERKLTSEADALLKLLDHPDESVRDAALGALVELRERRAVGVLAAQRSMRDRREMRKILDAIAVLGGDEASEYLAFVAEGHDDPEIREMATAARTRMQRRKDAAPAR